MAHVRPRPTRVSHVRPADGYRRDACGRRGELQFAGCGRGRAGFAEGRGAGRVEVGTARPQRAMATGQRAWCSTAMLQPVPSRHPSVPAVRPRAPTTTSARASRLRRAADQRDRARLRRWPGFRIPDRPRGHRSVEQCRRGLGSHAPGSGPANRAARAAASGALGPTRRRSAVQRRSPRSPSAPTTTCLLGRVGTAREP